MQSIGFRRFFCVYYVLLTEATDCQILLSSPVFPAFFKTIPAVFTVKVTAKKSGKKVSKTLYANAKVIGAGLRFTDAPTEVLIGSETKVTAKKCPSVAKVTFTSSDDAVATVDANDGTVKAIKAGKVTITATSDYGNEVKTDIAVKKYILNSVAQTKADTFETSVAGATKDIKAADITVKNTENNVIVPVKSVSVDSKDATKVTFTTFAGLTDGKTYDVTLLDGTTKQVVVSDGKVASVTVDKLTVPVATETEIKLVSKDANGVVLDESAYGSQDASKYDFSLTTNNGYVNVSKLYLNKIGDTATAEVTYKTGKYDQNGKPEGNVTSGKVTITAVDQAAVNNFAVKISSATTKKFDKIDANTQIAVGETVANGNAKYAYFQIKDADGNEVSNYYNYSVESSDKSILMLGSSNLDADKKVLVTPVKAGTAYILIKKDDKIVNSVAVTVVAERKVATMDVNKASATLSNTSKLSQTATVTASFKDQYAKDIDVTEGVEVTCLSTNAKDIKTENVTSANGYFSAVAYSNNKATVTFKASGLTAGTYQYKIAYKKDGKEVCARVITIVIQDAKATGSISFGLDVDKTEVDNLVDDKHKTASDYVVNINVNELRNGVAYEPVKVNTSYTIGKDTEVVKSVSYKVEDKDGKTVYDSASTDTKLNTVSGCAVDANDALKVTTVSLGAMTASTPAQKYFGAGTYKVTATVKTAKNGETDTDKYIVKTFTTTFTVKDSQPAGILTFEKDTVKDASSVYDAVRKSAKFVYGDKTYKDGSDDGITVVAVEGFTNDGKKIDKDTMNNSIATATNTVTITKVTFTVGDDTTSVNVDASASQTITLK